MYMKSVYYYFYAFEVSAVSTGMSDMNWEQVGGGEKRRDRGSSGGDLSPIRAQGFSLLLKDAASSHWSGLKNEQCTCAWSITDVL